MSNTMSKSKSPAIPSRADPRATGLLALTSAPMAA